MNLISFDIGIKNMAYCIFNISQDCCCTDWAAMNLMPSAAAVAKTEKPSCSSCKRKAKYKVKNAALFFCDAHAKCHDTYVVPTKDWTLASLRKKKVDELRQLLVDGFSGSKADALELLLQRVLEPAVAVPPPKKSANDADLIDVGRQLCRQLDAASLPERIDVVIIENQISPLAARMRTLQGMVTQYFILRFPEAQIQYVSSSMKLKAFSTAATAATPTATAATAATPTATAATAAKPTATAATAATPTATAATAATPTATAATPTAAQKYKQHKVDGVTHCAAMLRANPMGRFTADTLLSHSKKDDLADCWLQALWFLKHDGKINWSAEDLKIKCVDA